MTPTATNFWIRWRVRIGYPVALAYLTLARPTPRALAIGALVGALGIAIRAWAAGYLRKHEALAVSGPYAFTRNPLYFGSMILAAGFVVAGDSLWAAIIVAAYLALFYPAVMKREEGELRAHYGDAFVDYAARVPLFWPRLRPAPQPRDRSPRETQPTSRDSQFASRQSQPVPGEMPSARESESAPREAQPAGRESELVPGEPSPSVRFSSQLYRRNREYQAALGFLVGLALLCAKMLFLPNFPR